MENAFVPNATQAVVLKALNCFDAVLIAGVILLSAYNCVWFVARRPAARHSYIVLFYCLTFFCLVSWEITAIAQISDVDTEYLVFQRLDDPEYYHITADISQAAFLALFTLVSATMYHIDQGLALLGRARQAAGAERAEQIAQAAGRALRNTRIYNWALFSLIAAYLGMFVWIYFTPEDVPAKTVLSLNLAFRVLFLGIYLATVISLVRKLKLFPPGVLQRELRSIKGQFFAFLLGFTAEAVYLGFMISDPGTSFLFECFKTLILIVSFLLPIFAIVLAHYQTFSQVPAEGAEPAGESGLSGLRASPLQASDRSDVTRLFASIVLTTRERDSAAAAEGRPAQAASQV